MSQPGDRVEELFVFCVIDENDIEGLVMLESDRGLIPMMGADSDRAEQLKKHAEEMVKATGDTIKLYHFTNREEIEEFCG